MALSEALEAVGRMVDASPHRSQAGDGYLGTLAKLLVNYPRDVSRRCADPLTGVARETKFLPTVAEVVAWCERETRPYREDVAREKRVQEQLNARDEWQKTGISESFRGKAKAWLDRTDRKAQQLMAHAEETEEKRKAATLERMARGNRIVFERECRAAGIDLAGGVSPSLLRILDGKH